MTYKCRTCGIDKRVEDYHRSRRKSRPVQWDCKPCKKEHDRVRYTTDPRKKELNSRRKREFKDRLDEIKSRQGCKYCDEKDPCCLDFHHINQSLKVFEISRHGSMAWKSVVAEVEKCEVLCANCHRKLHAGRNMASWCKAQHT